MHAPPRPAPPRKKEVLPHPVKITKTCGAQRGKVDFNPLKFRRQLGNISCKKNVFFRALPERRHFSYRRCSLMMMIIFTITCASITHSEAVRCPPPLSPMMATFKEREIILVNFCHYLTLDESTPRVPALSTCRHIFSLLRFWDNVSPQKCFHISSLTTYLRTE